MIDHGARIKVVDVAGWYDAGKLDTLLETNRVMLQKGRAHRPSDTGDSRIFDPVYIHDDAVLDHATVGPNVSIGAGTVVKNSEIRDSVVGERATITHSTLRESMVGDEVVIEGVKGSVTLGDHSEVRSAI
jgi:glucose-1-phosphate thymidylyltransferase